VSRFVLTPDASEDLREIVDFIRKDSPDAARRVLREFKEAMRKLARVPGMGHFRKDLASEPVRFWPVYSYLIIYRPETKPLEVVRVVRGTRDILSLLESDG
jgi:plasmid stabilization system protein ParE